MACGAISESFPALDAQPRSRVGYEKCVVGFIGLSEKQYQILIRGARNCRFFLLSVPALDRTLSPTLENDNLLFFMMTGCSANPWVQRGITRNGKFGEARRSLHSARVRLAARPVRGAFARPSDRPVRATPQSTSARPAQAEGATGSASATAPRSGARCSC
jgi:hypothetical protein